MTASCRHKAPTTVQPPWSLMQASTGMRLLLALLLLLPLWLAVYHVLEDAPG